MRGAPITFKPSLGINNISDPVDISPFALVEGTNIDIRRGKSARRRKGYTKEYSGVVHSFKGFEDAAYFIEASVLKRLNTDYTSTILATLSVNAPADFVKLNNTVVCTNNVDIGFVENGTYSLPATPTERYTRAVIAGKYLVMFNGRMYIVTDTGLYFTRTYDLQTMDSRFCQIPLSGIPTMCGAVEDGLWISHGDKIAFLSGTGPEDFIYEEKADYPAVAGRVIQTKASAFVEGTSGKAVLFAARDGLCIGLRGGSLINLSLGQVSLEAAESFAGYVRKEGGYTHLVISLQSPDTAINAYSSKLIPLNPWNITTRVAILEGSSP